LLDARDGDARCTCALDRVGGNYFAPRLIGRAVCMERRLLDLEQQQEECEHWLTRENTAVTGRE
jgi:hypothetical protein